ncbi:hypothetical protein K1T71_011989 [Dendrolimus kikuchii]|uniref:Uncharacterized protein n=1 Tax=Dendrolimus kikuchii TaxID=765133 RepID=A0ACC1CKD1_9NEOP|nr:hypothetical protein K1T71_011989 [Dendrolimus kikuchii]
MRAEGEGGSRWQWQGRHQLSRVALELVFAWLSGAELARAGAVCRAWRRVAAAPSLWRHLLAAQAPLSRTAQLALLREVGWRQLYVEAMAGWEAVGHLQPSSEGLLHAALSPCGKRLALLSSDAAVSIWELCGTGQWEERWSAGLGGRGWASAERGEWAGTRLLVAGKRALAQHDAWELLVLARASGGAAGCWAGAAGDAFLSFELRSLAPTLAATTVWLNAATQETHSEYAGVTTPLLRIFNEGGHLLRALVAEVPAEESCGDGEDYLRATRTVRSGATQMRVLVGAWGRPGSGAVGLWALVERRPPPLLASAGGDLSARLRRWRAAREAPPLPERDPSEAEVRALCTPPDAACPLPARPTGLAVHPNGRCVWACWTGGGGACLSLPALAPLRALARCDAPSAGLEHYAQPAASRAFFAGRAPAALRLRGPALAALLPPRPPPSAFEADALLVLTPDSVHVWRSRATLQPFFEQ